MNKNELVEFVSSKTTTGVSKAVVTEILDLMLEGISGTLKDGGEARLTGFGTFKVGRRKESTGRNPRTGETMTIKAANRVKFTPGKELKEAVND